MPEGPRIELRSDALELVTTRSDQAQAYNLPRAPVKARTRVKKLAKPAFASVESPPGGLWEPTAAGSGLGYVRWMSVLIGTKIKVAAKRSVSAAAALLAAAAVFALVGCDRTEGLPNPASQTVQTASASAAAPIGYVYITNNGEGTLSEFSRDADGNLNFLRTAKAGAVNSPAGIAIDPSSRFLYVANEGDSRIRQFRIERDTGELAPIGEGAVDDSSASRPQQIAISPRGDFLCHQPRQEQWRQKAMADRSRNMRSTRRPARSSRWKRFAAAVSSSPWASRSCPTANSSTFPTSAPAR